ncbi:YfhD family protein [Halalkalibacter krulwichiae]|uniref:YfhD-like protein n=1 Tax=Halalkalibacter krulwichiae TaxID=199441 RepID=A0A1X9MEP2_9BACI|nr:YfhD family protein [Halalkalibacter krulwichiae]ARK30593.1 hypothetical protein BkAM31D_12555 [Halalkalibacter krulwichiae]
MGKKKKIQGKFDDVEYSEELADSEDQEAMARMEAADQRATKGRKKKNK